jgi:hypothetical protein
VNVVRSEEQVVEVPRAVETACGDSINQQLLGKNIFQFFAGAVPDMSWAKCDAVFSVVASARLMA